MNQLIRSLAAFGIALLFVAQVMIAVPAIQSALANPLQEPNRSYEQKMHREWGAYFDFMQFVQVQTPDNAVLLFNPNYFHRLLNLYFLYPRKLIYGGEDFLRNHSEIDYLVISESYPEFSVSG